MGSGWPSHCLECKVGQICPIIEHNPHRCRGLKSGGQSIPNSHNDEWHVDSCRRKLYSIAWHEILTAKHDNGRSYPSSSANRFVCRDAPASNTPPDKSRPSYPPMPHALISLVPTYTSAILFLLYCSTFSFSWPSLWINPIQVSLQYTAF